MALRYDVKIDYMHCELKLRLKYVLMIPLSFSDSLFYTLKLHKRWKFYLVLGYVNFHICWLKDISEISDF